MSAVHRLLLFILIPALAAALPAAGSESASPKWNELLSDWRYIGPIPFGAEGGAGLGVDYLNWTGKPDPAQTISSGGQNFSWKEIRTPHLHIPAPPSVLYAATNVRVEKKTEAILAVGVWQSLAIYQNDKEIFRLANRNPVRMDNYKVHVTLEPGDNWFLIKTASDTGHRVLARLLPADQKNPLLAFRYVGPFTRLIPQTFPDLSVTLLDSGKKPIAEYRVSGNVSVASELPIYTLYAPKPAREPATVRIAYAVEGAETATRDFPWKAAGKSIADFDLTLPQTFRVQVQDAGRNAPAQGVEVLDQGRVVPSTAKEDGAVEFSVPAMPQVLRAFSIRAEGQRQVQVQLKPGDNPPVLLNGADCEVEGRVLGRKKEPVPNVAIRAYFPQLAKEEVPRFPKEEYRATTDDKGKFVLRNLPADQECLLLIAPPESPLGYRAPITTSAGKLVLDDEFHAEPASRIRGRITHGGKPLRHLELYLSGMQAPLFYFQADAEGNYDIVPPLDTYQMIVVQAPDLTIERRLLDLSSPQSLSFDFDLTRGEPAYIAFRDGQGRNVSSVYLSLTSSDGYIRFPIFSMTDGRFVVPNMPKILLRVTGHSREPAPGAQFHGQTSGPGEYIFSPGGSSVPRFR